MRGFMWMSVFAVCVLSGWAHAQQQLSQQPINADIISAESINNAAEDEGDLTSSPASIQYRVRPFNYQQQQYQQAQALRQQQQQQQQEEDERAEASQEEPEEENIPVRQIQQQQQPQQPLYRRQFQQQQQQQQAQNDHPVYRKVEQNQKRLRLQGSPREQQHQQELEDELEAEEEPDRLTLLLEKSDFQCNGRSTGYYADEGLGCEVFHYCNENQKHSWICPEGFSFHQVHLICMPAGSDNVCTQSSKYHFVNDYLYKPINMEEHQNKPNVMLRYSERYFPEEIFQDERQEYDEEDYQPRNAPSQYRQQTAQQRQLPINSGLRRQPLPSQQLRTQTPQPQIQQQQAQPVVNTVFRSPEEINIPLQQRRPNYYQPTTVRYESQDSQEQQEEEEY